MKDRTAETWARVLEELGEGDRPGKLREYVDELSKWGERIHLTGREKMADAIAAQISDSMIMLELAGEGPMVADIGTGAGFPGIVWKLARPEWSIVLFERKERLATFLERTAALLGLDKTEIRAEDASFSTEEGVFDIVTSKAAGRLDEILPIARRMLKEGGAYVTAKGEGWEEELGDDSGFTICRRIPLKASGGEAIALTPDP